MLVQNLNAIFLQQFEGQIAAIEFSQENHRVGHRKVGVARCRSVRVRMDGDRSGSVVSERRQIDEQRPPCRVQQRSTIDRIHSRQRRKKGAGQRGGSGSVVGK